MNEVRLNITKGLKQDHSFALRVFDSDGHQILYRSTRLGTLDLKDINVPNEYIGFDYELKDISELKVISSGKIDVLKEQKVDKAEKHKDGADV